MQQETVTILQERVVVINVGPRGFAERLEEQGVDVTQVDWVPPAAGQIDLPFPPSEASANKPGVQLGGMSQNRMRPHPA